MDRNLTRVQTAMAVILSTFLIAGGIFIHQGSIDFETVMVHFFKALIFFALIVGYPLSLYTIYLVARNPDLHRRNGR